MKRYVSSTQHVQELFKIMEMQQVHRQQERTGSERTRLQILLNRRHLQVPHDERQGGWFAKVKGGRGSKPGEAESPGAQRSPKSSTDELC
uniref:Uncharacterized protein n=1 Tax=Myotis myotis TaxID=51298 RepID=A0A7J7Z5F5_MYOMY|nr:hypothetical protein mMyoMyo1_010643 [Myotis myotis]